MFSHDVFHFILAGFELSSLVPMHAVSYVYGGSFAPKFVPDIMSNSLKFVPEIMSNSTLRLCDKIMPDQDLGGPDLREPFIVLISNVRVSKVCLII